MKNNEIKSIVILIVGIIIGVVLTLNYESLINMIGLYVYIIVMVLDLMLVGVSVLSPSEEEDC